MSLTPEQWRELDEACRRVPYVIDNVLKGRVLGLTEISFMEDLGRHLRILIDAARPKCVRCRGAGRLPKARAYITPDGRQGSIANGECPDCIDHPGWAA